MTALRKRPNLTFLSLGFLVFVVATLGSDVIARTTIAGEDLWKAASQHVYYAGVQAKFTAMLLAPFLWLGCIAASAAERKSFNAGLAVFLLGTLLLGYIYFSGYHAAQSFAKQRAWTAAASSIGGLPFKSIIPLLVCHGLHWFLVRKKNEAAT
jgi:hypothetical protein